MVKNLPAMQETLVQFLGLEDPLEREQATHSSVLGLPLWLSWYRICLQCGRSGFSPWIGKIPWRRKGYPLQYSDLEKFMDCIVYRVAKNWTQLSDFHFTHNRGETEKDTYLEAIIFQNLFLIGG